MILTRDGKEITAIYRQDGSEVEEVKDANGRLVYSASREIVGDLPLRYSGRGKPLTDYMLYGNTVQDGTPSADAPVDVVGCGVRTGNLLDESNFALVQITSTAYRYGTSLGVLPQGTYTFNATKSAGAQSVYLTAKLNDVYSQTTISSVPFTFTADGISEYIIRTADNAGTTWMAKGYSDIMLNLGSTVLPYEPYGFKLPLTVNGTEYPIYLGQVETTRRIKKLVLTGEEVWQLWYGNYYSNVIDRKGAISTILCTHFINSSVKGISYNGQSTSGLKIASVAVPFVSSVNDLKAWLATQYAIGKPVTVWYVLAEPETALVNEPLMKIGDYADTISFAQAGVAIPTVNGANVLDMASTVKPSEVYIKGKGIKPTDYGQLTDVNGVNILDKDGRPIYVHGQ